MRDHVDGLVVVTLVDGAGELGVAHAGHPGQPDHAVLDQSERRSEVT